MIRGLIKKCETESMHLMVISVPLSDLNVSVYIERKLVARLCLCLCDPMGCRPPGSFVLGILQARVLEWVAISFSKCLY